MAESFCGNAHRFHDHLVGLRRRVGRDQPGGRGRRRHAGRHLHSNHHWPGCGRQPDNQLTALGELDPVAMPRSRRMMMATGRYLGNGKVRATYPIQAIRFSVLWKAEVRDRESKPDSGHGDFHSGPATSGPLFPRTVRSVVQRHRSLGLAAGTRVHVRNCAIGLKWDRPCSRVAGPFP